MNGTNEKSLFSAADVTDTTDTDETQTERQKTKTDDSLEGTRSWAWEDSGIEMGF